MDNKNTSGITRFCTRLTPVLFLTVASCSWIPSVGPSYQQPVTDLPQGWVTDSPSLSEQSRIVDLARWWSTLGDPKLDEIIKIAIEQNNDLKIAQSRVRQARAELKIQTAPLFPAIGGGGDFLRSDRSLNSGSTNNLDGRLSNQYSLGLDSSWEIDIFGGLRNSREAALAELDASDAQLVDSYTSLLAEVARTFVAIRANEKRLLINSKNLKSQTESLDLVRARFTAGLVSELDVAQAQTLTEQTTALIPLIEQSRRESINALAVLLGIYPEAVEQILGSSNLTPNTALATLPPQLPAGLPSDLLRQRPDIRKAERSLAAQNARIGVAIADYFPKFTLTGNFGYVSKSSGSLFESESRAWGLSPGVRLPIFEGGRIQGNVALQEELYTQAQHAYLGTVLKAVEETENYLSRYVKQRERQESLLKALKSSGTALSLSKELYEQGIIDFQRVLDAERSALLAEDEAVQGERAALEALILSYKALGGGWKLGITGEKFVSDLS